MDRPEAINSRGEIGPRGSTIAVMVLSIHSLGRMQLPFLCGRRLALGRLRREVAVGVQDQVRLIRERRLRPVQLRRPLLKSSALVVVTRPPTFIKSPLSDFGLPIIADTEIRQILLIRKDTGNIEVKLGYRGAEGYSDTGRGCIE
jgi:hypothetical protein